MDTRLKHLQTLGLPPDATSEQITEAYKDLMKVWHPDRFQNDARLLAKAQTMTQEINHAVSELRKEAKNPRKQKRASSRQAPPRAPNFSQGADYNRKKQASDTHSAGHESSHFRFTLSPLIIKMRFQAGLIRALGGALGVYLVMLVLLQRTLPPMEQAAIIALGFFAVDTGIGNLILTLIPRAIIRVDSLGIQIFSRGRFNWIDIETVYPVITARTQTLHITLSDHHIQKCAVSQRLRLRLRRFFGRSHIQLGFSALRGSPVQVLDAMHLFQSNDQIDLQEFDPTKKPLRVFCSFLSISTVLISLTHCLARGGLTPREFTAYFAVYAGVKAIQTFSEIFHK